MRSMILLASMVLMASLCGCFNAAPSVATNPTAATNMPPADSTETAHSFTEQDAPDFDPKLTLVWPGTPEESRRRIDAGTADETTIYSATFWASEPVTIFSATVRQVPEQDLQVSDQAEMLAEYALNGHEEVTRKQIEHGSNKFMGIEVAAHSNGAPARSLAVRAGTRIYRISVLSLKQERLSADDVTKFFDSFAIKD